LTPKGFVPEWDRFFHRPISSFFPHNPPPRGSGGLFLANELGVAAQAGARLATGAGQTIGITSFSDFDVDDVRDLLALMGRPPEQIARLSRVSVNGGAPAGPAQVEPLLDVAAVMSVAPDADIVVYDAPFTGPGTSFQALFNAMIDDGVDIISNSFAYCENDTTPADVESIDAILQTAAAVGISVFSASGDAGSTCLNGSPNTAHVPASLPHLTAVGGTTLSLGPGFGYRSETWWDGSQATPPTGQGGFGVSRFFTRPAYQDALSAHSMRSLPDVAVNADPASGYILCQANAGGCPDGKLHGGTSVAADWRCHQAPRHRRRRVECQPAREYRANAQLAGGRQGRSSLRRTCRDDRGLQYRRHSRAQSHHGRVHPQCRIECTVSV
jgi:subtilase family serine protease